MRPDGMTCGLRYSPVVTKGLCGTERIVAGDPHSIIAGDGHQGANEYHLARLGGPELLNDFVEQEKWWKHVH